MLSSRQNHTTILDVSGLHCPLPVIKCKAILATLEKGEILHMISTDRDAPREIRQLINYSGNRLCHHQLVDRRHHFQIEKCKSRSQTLRSMQLSISDYFQLGFSFLHRLLFLTPTQSQIIKGE